jgi:hypothetical protein
MNSAAPSQSKNLKPLSHEETLSELYEKPHFSLRQVKMICERLLKEQEHRLRYEYETLLIKKLEGIFDNKHLYEIIFRKT